MEGATKPRMFAWVPTRVFKRLGAWAYPLIGIAALGPLLFVFSFAMTDVPPTDEIPWTNELPRDNGTSREEAGVHWFKMEVEVIEGVLGTAECTSSTYEDASGRERTRYAFRDRPAESAELKLKAANHLTHLQATEFSATWENGGYAQFSEPGHCSSDSIGKIWEIGEGYDGKILAYEDGEGDVRLKGATYGQNEFPQFLIRENLQRIGMFIVATALAFWAGMTRTQLELKTDWESDPRFRQTHNFIKMRPRDSDPFKFYSRMLKKDLIQLAGERGLSGEGLKKEIIQRIINHDEESWIEGQINLWEDSGTKRDHWDSNSWFYPPKDIEVWDRNNRYGPDLDGGELMQEHPVVLGSHRPPILTNYSLVAFTSIITWTWLSSDLIARHHGSLGYGVGIFIRYATFGVALIWMLWSIRKWFVHHLVIDTPTQTIQSAAVGDAELCGQIRPGVEGTISADVGPWRLDGLISYSWTMDVWAEYRDEQGRRRGCWQRVDGDKKFVDSFILHDGSAGIKVNGKEWFDKEIGVQAKLPEGDAIWTNKGKIAVTGACLLLSGLIVIFVAQYAAANIIGFPELFLGAMIWGGRFLILSTILVVIYYLIQFTHHIREPAINFIRKVTNPLLLSDYGLTLSHESRDTRWEFNCIGGGDPLYIIGKIGPRTSEDLEEEGLAGVHPTELLEVGPREALETSIMRRGTELSLMLRARSTAETAIIPVMAFICSIIPFIWM